jgi:hypothetical protein
MKILDNMITDVAIDINNNRTVNISNYICTLRVGIKTRKRRLINGLHLCQQISSIFTY